MRNIKKIIALALALLLMLTLCTGCGAGSLLVGTWTDSTQTLTMAFSKDGSAIVTAYGIPLEVTYTYEGDTLTILYSENITEEGTVTFFGDDEFCGSFFQGSGMIDFITVKEQDDICILFD